MPKGKPSERCGLCRQFCKRREPWEVDRDQDGVPVVMQACPECDRRLLEALFREVQKIEEERL